MISFYVKKGRLPSEIYNLPEGEKIFLYSCMITEKEEENKKRGICPFLS
jgi:hypothetical protein